MEPRTIDLYIGSKRLIDEKRLVEYDPNRKGELSAYVY